MEIEKVIKLPIGIENFEKLRTEGFYYVDKTRLIKELLDNCWKVNLFTRPRRFGKSLNMSMLRYFFEYGCNSTLFDGLEISREKKYCDAYMGKFPVISITLKGVSAGDYNTSRSMLCSIIGNEAKRFTFLLSDNRLQYVDKKQYQALINVSMDGRFIMPDEILTDSLRILCELLYKHYGEKPILLIDEYDVPLDKAQQFGYYDEMVVLIRNLFAQVLKSNDCLQFAVLTGCLRIVKESIFTGLNNMNIFSITDVECDEHFGFSDEEVKAMLDYYGVGDRFDTAKAWYDGLDANTYQLAIPNLEIRQIFAEQIREWFQEEVRRDTPKLDAFCGAFLRGDAKAVEEQFSDYLRKTISIRDTGARKEQKENFYHGILLGLLRHRENWILLSNAESGEGFCDILVEDEEAGAGIVIEVKYRDDGDLEKGCAQALAQIEGRGYESRLRDDGIDKIVKYGIACYKKRCKVRVPGDQEYTA